MCLNSAGKMVDKWWKELEQKFPNTLTDSFQIMPNHLHSIFVILGDGLDMAALYGIGLDRLDFEHVEDNEGIVASLGSSSRNASVKRSLSSSRVEGAESETSRQTQNPQLGEMMQWFKTMATMSTFVEYVILAESRFLESFGSEITLNM